MCKVREQIRNRLKARSAESRKQEKTQSKKQTQRAGGCGSLGSFNEGQSSTEFHSSPHPKRIE